MLVAVCMDDACRHFDGNKRAKREVERAKEMLKASRNGRKQNRISAAVSRDAKVLEEVITDTAAQAPEGMIV